MKPLKIACVFGTRPEIIKMAPVILELQRRSQDFDVRVICSGQHRELLIPLIEWFGISVDTNMDSMCPGQSMNALTSRLMAEFAQLFGTESFDCVIGQGDTTTVLTSALAAFHEKIPFAHVEAGLRTFDMNSPFPEEMNRVLVGRLASVHYVPTESAAYNLRKEGVASETILLTGNTVIDALHYTAVKIDTLPAPGGAVGKNNVFVTAHRRENFGEPLRRICSAIRRIAASSKDIRIIFSVHPNPSVRQTVYEALDNIGNVQLVAPLPYPELVHHIQSCDVVLTDSGGLQEESPALCKPVVVLREETERPELVDLGGALLVGSDEELIVNSVLKLLSDTAHYQAMVLGYSPYGDGHAATRIVDHLTDLLRKHSPVNTPDDAPHKRKAGANDKLRKTA